MTPEQLLAAAKSAREIWWPWRDGVEFKIRSFQSADFDRIVAGLSEANANDYMLEVCRRGVVDWRGIRECDIAPGMASDPAQFDERLWRYWLDDQPDLWAPLFKAVSDASAKRREALVAARGKPAGSPAPSAPETSPTPAT